MEIKHGNKHKLRENVLMLSGFRLVMVVVEHLR
jgi:hypothetical protein